MAHDGKTCKHSICNCAVQNDGDYCSPYCETASDAVEVSCNCGHAGCAANIHAVV